jgi:hypothetical protein
MLVCSFAGMTGFGWNHEWDMSNILLGKLQISTTRVPFQMLIRHALLSSGAAAHWSSSGVKWILALDESCGPTLPAVTFTSGRPLVSIPNNATRAEEIYYNQDYYSIKHMSRFLAGDAATASGTGTVRVTTTPSANISTLVLESFYHAATQTVTVIALNTDHDRDVTVRLTQGEVSFVDTVPKFGTKVYQWGTHPMSI